MSETTVRVRPIAEADLSDYVRWFNDPEVTQWLARDAGVTFEEEREWFDSLSPRAFPEAIEVDGRHIGGIALRVRDDGATAVFALFIGEKSYWGRGYGTAATRQMLRVGFEERGLRRIELETWAHNVRAQRCYRTCGFRYEGVRRQTLLKGGRWIDAVMMAILHEEWDALQRPPSDRLCELSTQHIAEIIGVWEQAGLWPHTGEDVDTVHVALARMQQSAIGWREAGELVGTAFGAWDGFRGWLYRVAVIPTHRRKGIASAMVAEIERRLIAGGARQINLMMRAGDDQARALYTRLGYELSDASLMSKRFPAPPGDAGIE